MAFSGGKKKPSFLQKAGITDFKITMNNSQGISICRHTMEHLFYCVYTSVLKGPRQESFCSLTNWGIYMLYTGITTPQQHKPQIASWLSPRKGADWSGTLNLHSPTVKQAAVRKKLCTADANQFSMCLFSPPKLLLLKWKSHVFIFFCQHIIP